MMIQQDIIQQREHYDAIAFGGWSIDLHPADGVFSERPGCDQWHAKGVYQIPYRSMYSRNIKNLFLAGRIMSVSHVAFGSTRVMLTLANSAQAVGMAAAHCIQHNLLPRDITSEQHIKRLQRDLIRTGQHIPNVIVEDADNFASCARVTASSKLCLEALPDNGPVHRLAVSYAQLLPVQAGKLPDFTFAVDVDRPTRLEVELRASSRVGNHSPDVVLEHIIYDLAAGKDQQVTATFDQWIDQPQYVFVCLMANEDVCVHLSEQRLTGLLTVQKRRLQEPPSDIGVETFEFWTPPRRPNGQNIAFQLSTPLDSFAPDNVMYGFARPTGGVNSWVAAFDDAHPTITLTWPEQVTLREIVLAFDTDFDHAMETVLLGHPENVMPHCIKLYRVCDAEGRVLAECTDNHQTLNRLRLDTQVQTNRLTIELLDSHGDVPASLFAVRCYA
jgi:hypothetical protein